MSHAYIFRHYIMRAEMVEALEAYVNEGRQLGDFLYTVVCNDLVEAFARADDDNMRNMPAIAAYLYNEMPRYSWGSAEQVAWWHRKKEEDGTAVATRTE